MGYFSNGTEGDLYYEAYCSRCIFDRNHDCPIWALHLLHNSDECNKPGSFLHRLIPRKKPPQYGNEECKFFMPLSSIGLPLDEPQTALEKYIGGLGSSDQPLVTLQPDESLNWECGRCKALTSTMLTRCYVCDTPRGASQPGGDA